MRGTPEERFWAKVDKTPGHGPKGDCWVWTAARLKAGYGQFWFQIKIMLAHRFSWELAYRKPPNDLCVLHTCDNPPCVNPSHLFLGTNKDNSQNMTVKGRQAEGECAGAAKLTTDQVLKIYRDPRPYSQIIRDFPASTSRVSHIKSGRNWSHLTGHARKERR